VAELREEIATGSAEAFERAVAEFDTRLKTGDVEWAALANCAEPLAAPR
jgi:hypothetical protein